MSDQIFVNDISQKLNKNTFVRVGYTFGGWSTTLNGTLAYTDEQSISIDKNIVVYVIWTPNQYKVSYDKNATDATGTGLSSASTSVSIAKGSTGNRSYTANYAPCQYTVSYNLNGGSGSAPANQTKVYGTELTLRTYSGTKTGYTFVGWNTKAD